MTTEEIISRLNDMAQAEMSSCSVDTQGVPVPIGGIAYESPIETYLDSKYVDYRFRRLVSDLMQMQFQTMRIKVNLTKAWRAVYHHILKIMIKAVENGTDKLKEIVDTAENIAVKHEKGDQLA